MIGRRWTWAVALAGALAAAGCPSADFRPDAGYRGTWSRGNDRNVSIVAITDLGGQWRFRWTKRSFDGKFTVLCDWDGKCEERLKGELVATYTIVTRFDAASGKLYTDTLEERVIPERNTFRYTDVMEVADGGRTLWNYTVERDGQTYVTGQQPRRSFSKVSDSVSDPPKAVAR